MVQMLKEFSISSFFEPIDVVTFHTSCWLQLHGTYHRPQVSSIYFMRFLCFDTRGLCFQSKHCHFLHEPGMTHYKNYIIIPPYKVLVDNLINILRE